MIVFTFTYRDSLHVFSAVILPPLFWWLSVGVFVALKTRYGIYTSVCAFAQNNTCGIEINVRTAVLLSNSIKTIDCSDLSIGVKGGVTFAVGLTFNELSR